MKNVFYFYRRYKMFAPLNLIKAEVHLKAVFQPLNLGLIRISRSRFKQSKNSLLISEISVLGENLGWGIFGKR